MIGTVAVCIKWNVSLKVKQIVMEFSVSLHACTAYISETCERYTLLISLVFMEHIHMQYIHLVILFLFTPIIFYLMPGSNDHKGWIEST